MKKKLIQMGVLVGILVLLLAAYLLVSSLSKEPQENTGEETSTTYNVCSVDQNTVHKISYTLNGTEYAYSLKEDATGWLWSGDLALPLDNGYFAAMVTACASLTSTYRLTEVSAAQLVEFGLTEDAKKISFTDIGGARTYRIGTYNSFNGLCYFAEEGALTTVYMVDGTVANAFAYTPDEMIALPTLPTDIKASKITRLTLTPPTDSTDLPITYTYYAGGKVEGEADVWYGATGEEAEVKLTAEDGKALSTALSTLSFAGLSAYKADQQAELGLASPWTMVIHYKITQSFEDETTGKVTTVDKNASFTLLLGHVSTTGLRYATVEGSPLSCTLAGEIFASLTDGSLLKQ